jgi:very-short-patch-repair endonuclease
VVVSFPAFEIRSPGLVPVGWTDAMDDLLDLAAAQLGLFTASQWTGAGLSPRALRYRAAAGTVREIYPRVFAVGGAPPSVDQRILAACLSVGGVASHRCAARLWGFRRFENPVVEVLVRKDHTPRLEGVVIRRTGRLDAADTDTLRGIPVTRRARTLLDLCDVSPILVEGALNGALHRRQVSVRQLQAVLDRVGPQHPGSVRYRELVAPFAAGQRPTESELEDDFLELVIRRYNLPVPVRQHPVGRRRIDFAYPELVLGVEIESVRGHAAREDVHRNASKANELLEWWILRFAFDDIHRWPEETAELLDRTIAKRRRAA